MKQRQGMQSRDSGVQQKQSPGLYYCLQAQEKMEVRSQDSQDFVDCLRSFSANILKQTPNGTRNGAKFGRSLFRRKTWMT